MNLTLDHSEYGFGENYVDVPGMGRTGPSFYRMEVLRDIVNERLRQDELKAAGKFKSTCADNDIDDGIKAAVLTEETGEVSRVICEYVQGKLTGEEADAQLYTELVQVAAVATAWCECIRVAQEKRKVRAAKDAEDVARAAVRYPIGMRVRNVYRSEIAGIVIGITPLGNVEVHQDYQTDSPSGIILPSRRDYHPDSLRPELPSEHPAFYVRE
jgi:hypothetical protein